MKQLNHYETIEKMPKPSQGIDCILFICGITSENLGLILRSADVFGVSKVYYSGDFDNNAKSQKQLLKVSRNSDIELNFVSGSHFLSEIKSAGYRVIALEITDDSIPLRLSDISLKQKICLVIGNEQNGVPADILDICDCACHIEMIGGKISSLNVSIATSIALYEISKSYIESGE